MLKPVAAHQAAVRISHVAWNRQLPSLVGYVCEDGSLHMADSASQVCVQTLSPYLNIAQVFSCIILIECSFLVEVLLTEGNMEGESVEQERGGCGEYLPCGLRLGPAVCMAGWDRWLQMHLGCADGASQTD